MGVSKKVTFLFNSEMNSDSSSTEKHYETTINSQNLDWSS